MPKIVADVMTQNPIVASPNLSLKEAIQILAEHRISGLPVVNQGGELVGMVSETDIIWQESGITPPAYITILDSIIYLESPTRYEQELHKALGLTVDEVMTKKGIVTVSPDLLLSEAARLMNEKRVHQLPVVSTEEKLVGILSCGDIIQAMALAGGTPV
ncbi:MAG: CBS domain-containing protein [Oscillatoriales cyanobacterium RM2_1_1]|nr:CBS domain-containing protein [Oscillatoriales cyanobacterium SM2_3_0]NJO45758.1 CBS domain-containing protein [Oscillatoriales cyanobacterium RM2_1_1]